MELSEVTIFYKYYNNALMYFEKKQTNSLILLCFSLIVDDGNIICGVMSLLRTILLWDLSQALKHTISQHTALPHDRTTIAQS